MIQKKLALKSIFTPEVISQILTFLLVSVILYAPEHVSKRSLVGIFFFYVLIFGVPLLLYIGALKPIHLPGLLIIFLDPPPGFRIGFAGQDFYPITLYNIFAISVFFFLLWYLLLKKEIKVFLNGNPILLPFMVLIIGAIFTIPFLRDSGNFATWLFYAATSLSVSFLLMYSFRDTEDAIKVALPAYTIVVTALVFTVFIMPPIYTSAGLIQRYAGIFGTPNRPGILAAFSVILFPGMIFYSRNRLIQALYVILFAIFIIAILKTASRNAFIAAILGLWLFFFLITLKIKRKLLTILYVLGGTILTLIVAYILAKHAGSLFTRMAISTRGDLSILTRFLLWDKTLSYIIHNPIHIFLGSGPAQFYHYTFSLKYIYPHNIFVDYWFSFGIFGLIALFIWLYYSIKAFVKLIKVKDNINMRNYAIKAAAISSLFVFWLTGLVDEVQWSIWGIEVVYLFVPYLVIVFKLLDIDGKSNIPFTKDQHSG